MTSFVAAIGRFVAIVGSISALGVARMAIANYGELLSARTYWRIAAVCTVAGVIGGAVWLVGAVALG